MNETLETIRTRRSVRRFRPEQIGEDELQLILEAATWAPSGSNNQSWLFTAIQSQTVLAEVNELVRQAALSWVLPADAYPAKLGCQRSAANAETFCFHQHTPTLIIASNKPHYDNAMADCSCALQNMFLAATSLGLGSCWINAIAWATDYAPLREYLAGMGIPREHVICGSAAVGTVEGTLPPGPARKPGTTLIVRD